MTGVTIGKTAGKAGVNVETIRFYERIGLIEQPPKPPNMGFRIYPEGTLQRLRFIRQAQEIGFSLKEIAELLALRSDPSADCSDVREQAREKLAEVNRKITQLEQIRAALGNLIAACPGRGALRECSIMDALIATAGETNGSPTTDHKENAK